MGEGGNNHTICRIGGEIVAKAANLGQTVTDVLAISGRFRGAALPRLCGADCWSRVACLRALRGERGNNRVLGGMDTSVERRGRAGEAVCWCARRTWDMVMCHRETVNVKQ